MSKTLELETIDKNPAMFIYGKLAITMQASNDNDKCIAIGLNKYSAIKLRDFLNEFIGGDCGD